MRMNLFPAILLAGPPNCGKSVLAFLLTQRLRELGISHYLLRAVPDGEGDWYLNGDPQVVHTLRTMNKVAFSSQFIEHMLNAIESRLLPLLVDIGGRPQGDQLGLIKACTHYILLYRTPEERITWHELLDQTDLLPLAELRSSLNNDEEIIQERQPFLSGIISGLDRDEKKRLTGMTFGVLLERVAGICSYDAVSLEQEHLKHAPFPVINERELAKKLSVPHEGERTTWSPSHLTRISEFVPKSQPIAVYGRGPVWLASALAANAFPSPYTIYDARYGWLHPPEVHFHHENINLQVNISPLNEEDTWLEILLKNGTREPVEIVMNPIDSKGGVVISGKMPRWLFTTLTCALVPGHEWVAIDNPTMGQAIVVHSNTPSKQVGDVLPRRAQ
jgi:CRISPR-associated protein Csx3